MKKLVKKLAHAYPIAIATKTISRGKPAGGWRKKRSTSMLLIARKAIKIKPIWTISVIKVFNSAIQSPHTMAIIP